jgi:hypothetical protein
LVLRTDEPTLSITSYGSTGYHTTHNALQEQLCTHSMPWVLGTDGATSSSKGYMSRWKHPVHLWFQQQREPYCPSVLMWPDGPMVYTMVNENRWEHGVHYGFWEHKGSLCVSWVMRIDAATMYPSVLSIQGITRSITSYGNRWTTLCTKNMGAELTTGHNALKIRWTRFCSAGSRTGKNTS